MREALTMARDGWHGRNYWVPREALDTVRRRLGITDPVEVAIVGSLSDDTAGKFNGFRDGAWRISLSTHLWFREASLTLHHELVHVLQAQREGGKAFLDALFDTQLLEARLIGHGQRRLLRSWAYRRLPLERAAETRGRLGHRDHPLALRPA
jgi:hypothetical protein